MIGIIVVFPSRENAANIRNLLVRYGMTVSGVCTTGAQAMNHADALDEGIVVCGYKLKDMMYTELRGIPSREFLRCFWWRPGISGATAKSAA